MTSEQLASQQNTKLGVTLSKGEATAPKGWRTTGSILGLLGRSIEKVLIFSWWFGAVQ